MTIDNILLMSKGTSGFLVAMLEDSSLDLMDDMPLLEAVALWRVEMERIRGKREGCGDRPQV